MAEQQQQQQQPEIKTSSYANPMFNYAGSILYLTNPDEVIRKMELAFRGQREVRKGIVQSIGEPLMNEKGINSVVGMVQSIVNQAAVMSDFEKSDLPVLMEFLTDTVCKDLMLNRRLYEITNPAARDKILFEACTNSFVILRRSFEGGERRFWKGSQQEITTNIQGGQKKGLFSGLFNSGRR